MCKRKREGARAAVVWTMGALFFPFALAACNSDGARPPGGSTKPKAERDPAIGATLPEGPSLAISPAANDAARSFPLDATPSPDGRVVYYTALADDGDGNRVAGLFKVPAAGGSVEAVASGEPLSAPVGITVSLDGKTIFVADPGATTGGAVLTVPASGGAVAPLDGTEGFRPQGVTLSKVKGKPMLFFTGSDPSSGDPGLFSVDPSGGTVVAVASGTPFAEPGGVTVTASGDAYVADAATTGGFAGIIAVSDGKPSVFVERIGVGFPAGITTTRDESKLVVSGLDPATRTDVVYFVDVGSGELSALTDTVGAFHDPAGLHRAHDTDVFAWADSRANDTGTVYVLRP
jgi:hypothetical protein